MQPQLLPNGILQIEYENYQPWPCFRPLSSAYLGGLWRAHFLSEVLCVDDLNCAAWREPIPAEILRTLRRFPECHCELIEMAQAMPENYLRLVNWNPAMTLIAATYWYFRPSRRVPATDDRMTTWENLDPSELLNYTRFPTSKSFLRALSKFPIEHSYLHRIERLRDAWAIPDKRRLLQHLPVITGENIWLLSCYPPILDPAIHQLAAQVPRHQEFSILEIVSDLANRRELVCLDHWPYRNQIISWEQLLDAYNRFLRKTNCLPETLPEPPKEGIEDETVHIVPLKSRTALRDEAKEMCNCVEQYSPCICKRKRYAYKLLKPERATVLIKRQFRHWIIEEAMSKGNEREVIPTTMTLLCRWVRDRAGN